MSNLELAKQLARELTLEQLEVYAEAERLLIASHVEFGWPHPTAEIRLAASQLAVAIKLECPTYE